MNWSVAEAKQRLSEVIREAAREPQVIYNRNSPVAAVIAAEELPEYRSWKESRSKLPTLAEEFERLRDLTAGDPDPLPEPERLAAMRANSFDAAPGQCEEHSGDAGSDATR